MRDTKNKIGQTISFIKITNLDFVPGRSHHSSDWCRFEFR